MIRPAPPPSRSPEHAARVETILAQGHRGEASDREPICGALDELFENARQFNSSKAYLELMQFIGRFRFYSPFNAMLIHIQMPGARFVATARRWSRDFHRQIKVPTPLSERRQALDLWGPISIIMVGQRIELEIVA
jgi:hypothetical protein